VLKTHTLIAGSTYNIVVGGKGVQPGSPQPGPRPMVNQPGGAKITIT
jgi:hypothetical protein